MDGADNREREADGADEEIGADEGVGADEGLERSREG